MITKWQDREHRSHFYGRNGSSGWEFETREQALEYINDQYGHQRPEHVGDFHCEVKSNGVHVSFSAYGIVRTETYRKGATMRELTRVLSPSDCEWIVPESPAMAYCHYYRD